MHSVQPPRGRIVFEVLCLLAVVASCAGAWMQTGASALLGAASAALFYALVRLFDMRQSRPAAEPQRIDFEPEAEVKPAPIMVPLAEPAVAMEPDEAPQARAGAGRRKGGSRTGSGRRTKASKEAKIVELLPAVEQEPAEAASSANALADDADLHDETHHPVTQLFEPEPFVRQQRVMFGRKSH